MPLGDRGRMVHALAGRDVPGPGPAILPAHEGRGWECVCQAHTSCACPCLAPAVTLSIPGAVATRPRSPSSDPHRPGSAGRMEER